MTTPRDPDPLIRAFFAEGRTDLPDRTYEAVRADIGRTRQRVFIGPWRIERMNTFAKVALAAAAVAVVAVVGINLLPGGGGVGGGPAPTPSPTPSPSPSPSPAAFPPAGPLAIGTHSAVLDGVPLTFTVPASGWTSQLGGLGKIEGVYEQPGNAGINFWQSAIDNVYADPCAHTPLSPAPAATPEDLAAAVVKMPGIDVVTEPTAITIDGHPGQYVAFKIREDIACDPHDFYIWYDESTGGATGGWRYATALGALHRVWIVEADGKVIWIDSETFKGAKPELDQEIQEIVESITFE